MDVRRQPGKDGKPRKRPVERRIKYSIRGKLELITETIIIGLLYLCKEPLQTITPSPIFIHSISGCLD